MSAATLSAPSARGRATEAAGLVLDLAAPPDAFRRALERVGLAVAAKTTLPALTAVRITATTDGLAGGLTLYATNLDRAITAAVCPDPDAPIGVDVRHPGVIALPYAALRAALQHAVGDVLTLRATADAGGGCRAALRVGASRYTIGGLAPDEIVDLAGIDPADAAEIRLTAGALQRVLRRVAYATSTEASRPTLGGIALYGTRAATADGSVPALRLVATDSKRAADVRVPGVGAPTSDDDRSETAHALPREIVRAPILPRETAEAVHRLFDAQDVCTVRVGGRTMDLTTPTVSVRTRLVEGPFPAWDTVLDRLGAADGALPADTPRRATFDRAELAAALKRVAAADDDYGRVVLAFAAAGPRAADGGAQGTCELRTGTPGGIAAREVVACGYAGDGTPSDTVAAPFLIAFNGGYLADVLARTCGGPQVVLAVRDARTPALLADPDDPHALALVSPLEVPGHLADA